MSIFVTLKMGIIIVPSSRVSVIKKSHLTQCLKIINIINVSF